MLIDNPAGNYSFIRGSGPFSAAVRAASGFGIVRAMPHPIVPLNRGYELIERHLRGLGRPPQALCGMQLRIAKPLTREGFDQFNQPYIEKLRSWGLEVNGANPVTRTNVAFEASGVSEPMLAGFFFTLEHQALRADWIISGVAEVASRDGGVKVVAPGDTSIAGLRRKAECILELCGRHLDELGAGWADAAAVNLYTVHDWHPLLAGTLAPALGERIRRGLTHYFARPPVIGLELEIDGWAVCREGLLAVPDS